MKNCPCAKSTAKARNTPAYSFGAHIFKIEAAWGHQTAYVCHACHTIRLVFVLSGIGELESGASGEVLVRIVRRQAFLQLGLGHILLSFLHENVRSSEVE